MKNKFLNVCAITFIALAIVLALSWAGVELAIYYGNNALYTNMFFEPIYKTILFLEHTTLLGVAVTLTTAFITISAIAFGIFALKQKAMVIKYMDALDYQIDRTAAFYDKTYDETTPVSAYNQKRDESLELKVKYDIALNK